LYLSPLQFGYQTGKGYVPAASGYYSPMQMMLPVGITTPPAL